MTGQIVELMNSSIRGYKLSKQCSVWLPAGEYTVSGCGRTEDEVQLSAMDGEIYWVKSRHFGSLMA